MTHNSAPYDHINVIGTGGTTVSWDESLQRIEIRSGDSDTTYDLTSRQDGANVAVDLTDSGSNTDTVTLVAGANITLTDDGSNNVTIESTDTSNEFTNTVGSITNGIAFNLIKTQVLPIL